MVIPHPVECRYNAVHDIVYSTKVTEVEYKSEFESTKGTTYLALTFGLWGVFSEYFGENWPRYNGPVLYFILIMYHVSILSSYQNCHTSLIVLLDN